MTHPEPIHPGEHLAEIMQELGITQYRLAKTIGVPPVRVHDIVNRRRSITADTALRIGRALGTTPEFWLNRQRMYDLDLARTTTDVGNIKHSSSQLFTGAKPEFRDDRSLPSWWYRHLCPIVLGLILSRNRAVAEAGPCGPVQRI